MRIAFLSAECTPIIKVGGLADVVGALPKALAQLGHDVRVFLPLYEAIDQKKFPVRSTPTTVQAVFNGQPVVLHLSESVLPNSTIPVYYVSWPDEFLGEVYPLGQDVATLRSDEQRFLKYSLGLIAFMTHLPWRPDIIHCHDWHTALVPSLLKHVGLSIPTVLTIHNLASQGKWSPTEALTWLGIHGADWIMVDRKGDFNALQHGIRDASAVTTVSPTYAKEILLPEFGEGLENELRQRPIVGIINGIDTQVFDPRHDVDIPVMYDENSFPSGKAAAKAAVQTTLGLPLDPAAPLFICIGRLTNQKGIDLILPQLEWLSSRGQVAILGSGFPDMEQAIEQATRQFPTVRARIGFDAKLAQVLYAGGDFLLMPSRFEPCGLGQMIAMRYGTIPIVRDTGGLHDSVIDWTDDPAEGTGIRFSQSTASDFHHALDRAFELFSAPNSLVAVIRRSMAADHSWYTSAQNYAELYQQVRKV